MIYVAVVAAVILLYCLSVYNKLAATKVRIIASIQEIGNVLKRQSQLLPQLAELFNGAKKQEKEIYKMLSDARKTIVEAIKSGDDKAIEASQEYLNKALGQIKVTMESNPQFQSIGLVSGIMEKLTDAYDKVTYARRLYIDLSADYNIMLVTLPSNIVANLFGFKQSEGLKTPLSGEFLEVSEEETKSPDKEIWSK